MTRARYPGYLTDVPGFSLGNLTREEDGTGVSVILAPEHTSGGVDVRGGSPGTRETDLLRPENAVQEVNAVVLAGGSAFGLDASSGVMTYLREQEIGFETGYGKVPIVCSCVLFDLGLGRADAFPLAQDGYEACKNASRENHEMGNVGAGTGASVGKIAGGERAMKAGLGQASLHQEGLIVSCVVAVNALGDIIDSQADNERIAGLLDEKGQPLSSEKLIRESGLKISTGSNTTIACLATNAKLDKAGCLKVSQMAHDGYAKAIHPVHTTADGDSIFTLASNQVEADINIIGVMAVEVVRRAIVNAGVSAEKMFALPAYVW